jgi:hypothetical protein
MGSNQASVARTSTAHDWLAKAEFMRTVRATHASWNDEGELVSLDLAPPPPPPLAAVPSAPRQPGPAMRMAGFHQETMQQAAARKAREEQRRHEVLFASSSMRPKLELPADPPSVVPRAVRERAAAEQRGAKKRTKR